MRATARSSSRRLPYGRGRHRQLAWQDTLRGEGVGDTLPLMERRAIDGLNAIPPGVGHFLRRGIEADQRRMPGRYRS
jgi:hypothetical protein